jgi:3alpha(or 20beta)-hydroxysteroid dehydrogenase
VALISGGARGQGEAEARLFIKEGAQVVCGDILVEAGRKVAAAIVAQGGQATFVKLDVTQESDWRQAAEATINAYGKLDILVNNASVTELYSIRSETQSATQRKKLYGV